MLFNSIDFALFLSVVFIVYWFLLSKSLKLQNLFLLFASYVFYAWWDWRFLSLIVFSTLIDYTIGRKLEDEENVLRRKIFLWTSIIVNLGFLCVFKYYNFFLESLYEVAPGLKAVLGFNTLNIILPVGISFYTFQTLSYTIDIYNKKLSPAKNIVDFAAFVAFFPQLVAGPIERATNLLPQFYKRKKFDYYLAVDGLRQILWGLFKKVVIADNCADYANMIFNNSDNMNGSTLLLGAFFFAFQIYGDFSGYSDIAIGTSRLFGFNLKQNFAFPYFSRDIAEFWRRWHISLSTWFRDYLYIPLGGSRVATHLKIRNTFIVFIVSGIWHGANWTFLVWGLINAVLFLPLLLTNNNRANLDVVAKEKVLPSFKELIQILFTFTIVTISWIFFRSENISHAISYLSGILSLSFFEIPVFNGRREALTIIGLISIFLVLEWNGRHEKYAISNLGLAWSRFSRWGVYILLAVSVLLYSGSKQEFIYFQF